MFGFLKKTMPAHFFDGFCDMHCHILPGVDDGVKTEEESVRLLKILEEQGFRKVIFTPHLMNIYPDNTRESLLRYYEYFKNNAIAHITMELSLGGEYMFDSGFAQREAEGLLMLKDKDKMFLIETSYLMCERGFDDKLFDLLLRGFQPVIAHPERYQYASKRMIERWHDMGCMLQLNLFSLAGAYGARVMSNAIDIMDKGWYDFVGTDIHSERAFNSFVSSIRLKSSHIGHLERLVHNNKIFLG